MFDYNIEYRKNILFIRMNGNLNSNSFSIIEKELDIVINKLGFYNIVFNFELVDNIDIYSINKLIGWYNLIKKRKGVSYICGINSKLRNNKLLNYMNEISDELCAIRVINWKN